MSDDENGFVMSQSSGETGPVARPAPEAAPSALADLLARAVAAEGPDREIDAEIAVALSGDPDAWVVNPSPHSIFAPVPGWWRDGHDKSHSAPELTASLDASLALLGRLLPARAWVVAGPDALLDKSMANAEIAEGEFSFDTHQTFAKTPALALLATLLKALIAETASPAERPVLPGDDQ